MWISTISCYHSYSLRRTKIALRSQQALLYTVHTNVQQVEPVYLHICMGFASHQSGGKPLTDSSHQLLPFFHTSIMFLSSKEHCYSQKIFQTARKLVDLRVFINHITHSSATWIPPRAGLIQLNMKKDIIHRHEWSPNVRDQRPVTLSRSSTTGLSGETSLWDKII